MGAIAHVGVSLIALVDNWSLIAKEWTGWPYSAARLRPVGREAIMNYCGVL